MRLHWPLPLKDEAYLIRRDPIITPSARPHWPRGPTPRRIRTSRLAHPPSPLTQENRVHTQTPAHHTIFACKPTAFHLPCAFMRRSAYGGRLVGQDSRGNEIIHADAQTIANSHPAIAERGAPRNASPEPPQYTHHSLLNFLAPSLGRFSNHPSPDTKHTNRENTTIRFLVAVFSLLLSFFAFRLAIKTS
jgi:hypothetical protein